MTGSRGPGGRAESIDDMFARYGESYRLYVTCTGMVASFAMVVSGGIANVAVPDIMGAFGIGLDQAGIDGKAFPADEPLAHAAAHHRLEHMA